MVVNPIIVENFAPLLNSTTVGLLLRQNDGSFFYLFQMMVLYNNVCGRVLRVPVCCFLCFGLHIATEPFALFHHGGFDYMCFTVMCHR